MAAHGSRCGSSNCRTGVGTLVIGFSRRVNPGESGFGFESRVATYRVAVGSDRHQRRLQLIEHLAGAGEAPVGELLARLA
eukprot:5092777-Prymnesium_polylepis.1